MLPEWKDRWPCFFWAGDPDYHRVSIDPNVSSSIRKERARAHTSHVGSWFLVAGGGLMTIANMRHIDPRVRHRQCLPRRNEGVHEVSEITSRSLLCKAHRHLRSSGFACGRRPVAVSVFANPVHPSLQSPHPRTSIWCAIASLRLFHMLGLNHPHLPRPL